MRMEVKMKVSLFTLMFCMFHTTNSFQPWGTRRPRVPKVLDRALITRTKMTDDDSAEDWRAFRAKLVLNETTTNSNDKDSSSWAYDSGLLVEKGSIVVSRVESSLGCHDLRQPYFCKCIILIVEHDEEFTQGIILNRPSNLYLNDEDIVYVDEEEDLLSGDEPNSLEVSIGTNQKYGSSWRMLYGGDLAGIYDDNPLIVCLHNLTSELAQSVSDEVMPGVYLTSHLAARALVEEDDATPDSFFTFYGFCGWDPGQLEKEVKRGSWYMVSAARQTLWDELGSIRDPATDPRDVGLKMWQGIVEKIGNGNEIGQDNSFAELMLKEWATEMLMVSKDEDDTYFDDTDIFRALNVVDQASISPGALFKASPREVSPFLLQEQFLHKSTLLLLQDTESFSVGLVLNLPTTEAYVMELSDGSVAEFPIRFGGTGGDEESALVWLHKKNVLKQIGIGKAVGPDDDSVFTCTLDQVEESLLLGLASPDDFILVRGFCMWEKEAGSGGILGQVRAGNFETILSPDTRTEVWSLLLTQQRLLDEATLTTNIDIGSSAWSISSQVAGASSYQGEGRYVHGTTTSVTNLADSAVEAWAKIYLLGNAEYYW